VQSAITPAPPRISIHAPVKGATTVAQDYADELEISIHAPVKGATPIARSRRSRGLFQSTHP